MTAQRFEQTCRAFLHGRMSLAQLKRTLHDAEPEHGDSELWQAAKQALKNGNHPGACDNDADPWTRACSIHIQHFNERRKRLAAALGERWESVSAA